MVCFSKFKFGISIRTVNSVKCFNASNEYGTIKKGAVSDLILLNGNPLEDISQAKNIAGVMLGKRWLSREFIDKELAKIAEKYKE